MSTPPYKNVTHVERDPALEAAEKNLRYVVHDEAWTTFWALDATFADAQRLKERIAGSRECRTVAMTPYPINSDVTPILQRVGVGQPGATADPNVRAAIARIRQQIAAAQAQQAQANAEAAQAARRAAIAAAPPPLPDVVIDGRPVPRQPQLVSVPPVVIPPPLVVDPNSDFARAARAPLPRDPNMPPAIAVAPPAPQPLPPPVVTPPGPSCDACGNAVAADLPETNGMRICDACQMQGALEDKPLEDLV